MVFNNTTKTSSKVKASTFQELKEKVFQENPSYIGKAILPFGSTCGIYGDSKTGKSFLCLNMARALALGENLYEIKEMPVHKKCTVLYVEQEIGEIGLQERVARIFPEPKLDNIYYVSKAPDLQLHTQEGQDIIKDLILDIHPNVIIFDTIGKQHQYEENSNTQIGELFKTFEEFKKIRPEDNLAIVYSHHVRKPSGYIPGAPPVDPLDPHKASGAGRWFRDPDTIITTHRYDTIKIPWEKWKLRVRITLRHGSSPEDFALKVNHDKFEDWNDGDLRVRYHTDLGNPKPLFTNRGPQKTPPKSPPTQDPLFKL